MKCPNPNCGCEIPSDSKFCPDCGHRIYIEDGKSKPVADIQSLRRELEKKEQMISSQQQIIDNTPKYVSDYALNINGKDIIYSGFLIHGRMGDRGTIKYGDGSQYCGDLQNDKMHGHGTYTWPSGSRYDGNWEKNNRHGHGTMIYSDGSRYDGNWENDEPSSNLKRELPEKSNGKKHWWFFILGCLILTSTFILDDFIMESSMVTATGGTIFVISGVLLSVFFALLPTFFDEN